MSTDSNQQLPPVMLRVDKGCVLITKAGQHFSCSDTTVAKAMVIYHRYRRDGLSKEWRSLAAFDLSADICKEKVDSEKIVKFFADKGPLPLEKDKPLLAYVVHVQEVKLDIVKEVFKCKYHNTKANCSFYSDPASDIAHRFIDAYMKAFSPYNEVKHKLVFIKEAALKTVNTFYHCPMCIKYTPLEITWAAIHTAFLMYHVDIESVEMIKREMDSCIRSVRLYAAFNDLMAASMLFAEYFEHARLAPIYLDPNIGDPNSGAA